MGKPLEAIKAIDKMIVLGSQADPKLLKAAADAHHKAIGSISGANGVTSKADWEAVNAALGRVFASVPESTVKDADAEKAYEAFLTFKDVVKKNQVSSAGASASVPSGDKIGEAAKKLSDAAYPFLKEVDWTSDLF